MKQNNPMERPDQKKILKPQTDESRESIPELPHEVVLDLLPLYEEHLLSAPTEEMVKAHLKTCSKCARALEEVPVQEEVKKEEPPLPPKKNWMKKIRFRIWLLCALVIVLAAGLIAAASMKKTEKEFPAAMLRTQAHMDGSTLVVQAIMPESYPVTTGLGARVETKGNVVIIHWLEEDTDPQKRSIEVRIENPQGKTVESVNVVYYQQDTLIADKISELWYYAKTWQPDSNVLQGEAFLLGMTHLFNSINAEVQQDPSDSDLLSAVLTLTDCQPLRADNPWSPASDSAKKAMEQCGLLLLAANPSLNSVSIALPGGDVVLEERRDRLERVAREHGIVSFEGAADLQKFAEAIGLPLKNPVPSMTPVYACNPYHEPNALMIINRSDSPLNQFSWKLIPLENGQGGGTGEQTQLGAGNSLLISDYNFEPGVNYRLEVYSNQNLLAQAEVNQDTYNVELTHAKDGWHLNTGTEDNE